MAANDKRLGIALASVHRVAPRGFISSLRAKRLWFLPASGTAWRRGAIGMDD